MYRWIYILVVAMASIVVSCNDIQHSVDMHDVEERAWSTPEVFLYENEDSLTMRDLSIVVRYGTGYVSDSVSMRILTISPDSMVVEEPFTLHIPRIREVRPTEQTFLYRRNVILGRKGTYEFRLLPDTATKGINSIGIMVGEPTPNIAE